MPNVIQIVFLVISALIFAYVCVRFAAALSRRIKKKRNKHVEDHGGDNVSQEEK